MLTLTEDEDGLDIIDITGDSFLLAVDPSNAPEDSSGNIYVLSGTIVDGPAGQVVFAPSTAQAASAPAGDFFYDVQWTRASDGRVKTILAGAWVITQDVTK